MLRWRTSRNFIIDQASQALRLQVLWFVIQQCVVVPPRLSIVPEFVVA
jgi:hypothetical protein